MNETTAKRISGFDECDETVMSYWKVEGDGWYLNLPGCGLATLRAHKIVEHENGTITAEPSILTHGHNNGVPVTRHGYLVCGVWNEC